MEQRLNWLNELSKNCEYNPKVVGSNYQPLGLVWSHDLLTLEVTDREFHRGVYFKRGNSPIVLVAGGRCKRRGILRNDLYQFRSSLRECLKVRSSCEWSPREHFSMLTSPNGQTLYIIGGFDGSIKSDVWVSHDYGGSFTCQTEKAPWEGREHFSCTLVGDNTLVVCGGRRAAEELSDVWVSKDGGKCWERISKKSDWKKRSGASLIAWRNELLLVGGSNEVGALDDVWSSEDGGKSWKRRGNSTPWKARHSFSMVCDPISSEIVIFGGTGSEGQRYSDVWASLNGGYSWIPRKSVPEELGNAAFIVTDEGSLVAVGSRSIKKSISDLSFVKKDSLTVLTLGSRIGIPTELWTACVLPFAVDTRQLWNRSNAHWNRLIN